MATSDEQRAREAFKLFEQRLLWEDFYAGWQAHAQQAPQVRDLFERLQEVSEVLTELGWHTDRGLLMRVNEALAANPQQINESAAPARGGVSNLTDKQDASTDARLASIGSEASPASGSRDVAPGGQTLPLSPNPQQIALEKRGGGERG